MYLSVELTEVQSSFFLFSFFKLLTVKERSFIIIIIIVIVINIVVVVDAIIIKYSWMIHACWL